MIEHKILTRVYGVSVVVITSAVLLICLFCKWHFVMIGIALLACIVLSSPATIALQILVWLSHKIKFEGSFPWMLLLSSIPVLALFVAWLLADYVPGKTGALSCLGIASGYVGILSQGISVAQVFNTHQNEKD
jgi:hypothetical protein